MATTFEPRTEVEVEWAPGKHQTVKVGATVTYHGKMGAFQAKPLTVKAMDPAGLLTLVTAEGRMAAQVRPQLVRVA